MIVSVVFAVVFIVLAVVFLMGKGDKLIAGYNTASEEERAKVNIKRLRILMAIVCVITVAFCGILPFIGDDPKDSMGIGFVYFVIIMIFIILSNTWAKKK